jgi:hypothetical protein
MGMFLGNHHSYTKGLLLVYEKLAKKAYFTPGVFKHSLFWQDLSQLRNVICEATSK